jgi:hypothetical protein
MKGFFYLANESDEGMQHLIQSKANCPKDPVGEVSREGLIFPLAYDPLRLVNGSVATEGCAHVARRSPGLR